MRKLLDNSLIADTKNKLTQVVARTLVVNPTLVASGARFYEDLNADSLDQIALVMAVEEEFNLEINEDSPEVVQIKTVGGLLDYIENRIRVS